ncbi:MAG: saccharopine dehydrogenase C-terminal domain-containing protein, partial [Ferruginibacter sp.]
IIHKDYKELFKNNPEVTVQYAGKLAFYPNRDSLNYLPVYKLEQAATFLRTTLRHPFFCVGWNAIAQAGLSNDTDVLNINQLTFKEWSAPIIPFIDEDNKVLLEYLGLFDQSLVPIDVKTSADILQHLLETRLMMQPHDKDMIVMLHEIEYKLDGKNHKIESSLIVKGKDHLRTAMAKTVGLPLGIAAKLILNGTIQLTGIHIPTIPEIYGPVLSELEKAGICFVENHI